MTAIPDLDEDEKYLAAILDDPSGIELAEFCMLDETPGKPDPCFRVRDYQWSLYTSEERYQVEHAGRDLGKSLGVQLRAFAFPFNFPGQEMLITAPQLNHLGPIVDKIEGLFMRVRLGREMLPRQKGGGIKHQPQFQATFINGAVIMGRLPGPTGSGVKGQHAHRVELDEGQDFPEQGWLELIETMKDTPGSQWRVHGVSRGVRDMFYRITQHDNPDLPFYVHRYMAMHRPGWNAEERRKKIALYGGSRDNPDYKRNILGEHGDISSPVLVLARLMACVRMSESTWATEYNENVYAKRKLEYEFVEHSGMPIEGHLKLPASHLLPGYKSYWAGMDIGMTNDPSELLVFGLIKVGEKDVLRLLTRIHMMRISAVDQAAVIMAVADFYGDRLKSLALDKMQPVSEPVLTPGGWRAIGSLRVGDEVIGSDGKPTLVTGVYPQEDRRVMRVTCSDGSWTRCGPEHLWTVHHTQHRDPAVMTTEQIAATLPGASQNYWTVPMLSAPADLAGSGERPVDPYLLGALLGDGNLRKTGVRFSSVDPEILAEVEGRLPDGHVLRHTDRCNYQVVEPVRARNAKGQFPPSCGLLASLRELDLAGKRSHEKAVPSEYLTAPWADRLLLLQGIMDTDGWVSVQHGRSSCGIRSSSEQLIKDVVTLVESLGGSARYAAHATSCNGKAGRTAYRASIAMPEGLIPFRLSRKRDAVVARVRPLKRYIASIEPDGEEDSVCIRVAAEDHLYVTRHHLLTHNTGLGLPIWQETTRGGRLHKHAVRIKGYGFSEKRAVAFDDRPLERREKPEDAVIEKNIIEHATDELRSLVDGGMMELPYDTELLGEFQGQVIVYARDASDKGRKVARYGGGSSFHTMDAAKLAVLGKSLDGIEQVMGRTRRNGPVLDAFMGN